MSLNFSNPIVPISFNRQEKAMKNKHCLVAAWLVALVAVSSARAVPPTPSVNYIYGGPTYSAFAVANGWVSIDGVTGTETWTEGYRPTEDLDEDGLDNEAEWKGWPAVVTNADGSVWTGWYSWDNVTHALPGEAVGGPKLNDLDSDNDGIADYWESPEGLGSDPLRADSDGDGMHDAWEAWFGLNYLSAAQVGVDTAMLPVYIADEMADPDGDGLTSGEEYNSPTKFAGTPVFRAATVWELSSATNNCGFPYGTLISWVANGGTSPVNYDTDGDELIDSLEIAFGTREVLNPGIADAADADLDADGLTNFRELCVHPLLASFATGSAIPTLAKFAIPQFGSINIGWGYGSQGLVVPGYMMAAKFNSALNTEFAPGDVEWGDPGLRWTNPRNANTDTDGLPDGWELEHGLNPLSAGLDGVENLDLAISGALGDPDQDTLFNMQEYFGQDGYRLDYITGTGDESNPWIARLFNHPALSDFAREIGQGTIGNKGHQAPVGYVLGLAADYITDFGSGPYWGFFDPASRAAGMYVPIAGVPPFVAVNDEAYLGLDPGSFQPFATAVTGLSWYDQDGDGFYTPGVDLVWLAVTDPAAYTPGDPILNDFYLLADGVAPGVTLPSSGQPTDLRYREVGIDGVYTPGEDPVWMPQPATPDEYSIGDDILFDDGTLAAAAAVDPFVPLPATGPLPPTAQYNDADGNALYTPLLDPVWLDDNGDNDFTQADPAALPPVVADTIVDDVGMLETGHLQAPPIVFAKTGPLTDAISTIWPMPGTDTDDDGWADQLEIQMDIEAGKHPTSPVQSHNPFAPRSALLTTDAGISPNLFAKADSRRFFGRDFTVESWVYFEPDSVAGNDFQGSLIRGDVVIGTKVSKAFDLGVKKINDFESVPYVALQTLNGTKTYTCAAARSIPYGKWVHLAGVFDHKRNHLSLYINGLLEQSLQVVEDGAGSLGAQYGGTLVLGQSSGGSGFMNRVRLDEVRIWGSPRTAAEIADNRLHLIDWVQLTSLAIYEQIISNPLLAYFTFDDGGNVAEDLVRKAKCSLLGYAYPHDGDVVNFPDQEYLYPDTGFGIASDAVRGDGAAFTFDANNPAEVIGFLDGERGEFDSDRDGLPDSWEIVHELNPFMFGTPLGHDQLPQYDPAWTVPERIMIRREDRYPNAEYPYCDTNQTVYQASLDNGATWVATTSLWVAAIATNNMVICAPDPLHLIIADGTNFAITASQVLGFLDNGGAYYVKKDGTAIAPLVSDALLDMELPDGDGLDNQYEYWAHTNPRKNDTDVDGIVDGEEDFDGDGLPNRIEKYMTSRPDLRDTDDDGVPDSTERARGASAVNSGSPAKNVALYLDGKPGSYLELADRSMFRLANWTVEAKVLPSTLAALQDNQGASIVRRVVQDTTNNVLAANFDLRVVRVGDGTNSYLTPEIRYVYVDNTGQGQIVSVRGSPLTRTAHRLPVADDANDPYPTKGMTHLAATYDSTNSRLVLYMNGSVVTDGKFPALSRPPQSGKGARAFVRIGEGFAGFVDDVRIWSQVRAEDHIYNSRDQVDAGSAGLLARYTLDDGGWPLVPVKGSVLGTRNDPPAAEANAGDRYLVSATPSGDWSAYANHVAEWSGSAWVFTPPSPGMRTLDQSSAPPTVLEWDPLAALWVPVSEPALIRGVDYNGAPLPHQKMDGISWWDGANIVTIDSGVEYTNAPTGPVFHEGTVYNGAFNPGDFAWWNSKSEYYRWDGAAWLRWGPALHWLAPARLKVDGVYPDATSLYNDMLATGGPSIGDRFIVEADAAIYTALNTEGDGSEDYNAGEPLNDRDRVLTPAQDLLIWDAAAGAFVTLANAATLGGDLYVHVRSEGTAYKSDGARWTRWGMIPTSEDGTATRDWNNQWRNAARVSGHGLFVRLDGETPSQRDTDGDGLPDDWEIANGLDPNDPGGNNGRDGDPDNDGLSNFNEYLLDYDPNDADTNNNGINDGEEDFDRDGLPNAYEQDVSRTRIDRKDTDDDGLTDYDEAIGKGNAKRISNPVWSLDPPVRRSMEFTGNGRLTVEPQARHHLQSWTVMGWVKPSETLDADSLIVRRILSSGLVNYELGLRSLGSGLFAPYVRHLGLKGAGDGSVADTNAPTEEVICINTNGPSDTAGGHQASGWLAAGEWTHVAGSYDATAHTMSLYVNGELSVYRNDVFPPGGMDLGTDKKVMGDLTIGGGRKTSSVVEQPFQGWLDDVKVLSGATSAEQVRFEASRQIATSLQTINQAIDPEVRQLPIAEALQYEHTNAYVMVRFKAGTPAGAISGVAANLGLSVAHSFKIAPIHRLELAAGSDLGAKLAELRADPNVLYAEPDYVLRADRTPNDPLFLRQWGLNNPSVPSADIGAVEAWNQATGSRDVIVAVIDTGVDYTHPDLAANMWVNEGEIPANMIDDDGNGYVDDVNGWNFSSFDVLLGLPANDPMDYNGHGTHVAGIIGAVGNNRAGVAGVNWNVRIMPISYLGYFGMGFTSDAIMALEYAWQNGARISNNSWGGGAYSQALRDAIQMAGAKGHLFVAAAGNSGTDNDAFPHYPSSYDLPYVVAVAATDMNDQLADFSCFGAASVDLAAPGVGILSTYPNSQYLSADGTSMATPFVTGAAALLASQNSMMDPLAIKRVLLQSVDKLDSLTDKVASSGRLNLAKVVGGSQVLHLAFDDGGALAEDFTVSEDWNSLFKGFSKEWFHAAMRYNADFSTNTFVPVFQDTDGDGLPDWWEEAMRLDPMWGSGLNGADGDPDNDGLTNFYEFLAGTNPFDADTNHDAVNDFNADSDGDGLTNGQEQQAGTLPGAEWLGDQVDPADTDDDGVKDIDEIAGGTDPVKASSPDVARAMRFAGSGRLVVGTEHAEDASLPWTVEGWVKPVGDTANGVVIRRAEIMLAGSQPWVDYELGLASAKPYISFAFRTEAGGYETVRIDAPKTIPANQWSHVAAVRDPDTLQTRLFVNGKCVAHSANARLPAVSLRGVFETSMGDGFVGELDAVRVWHYARTGAEIQNARDVLLPEANINGAADKNRAPKRIFNFDDGGKTAENSFYLNDWMANWQNAATLAGDAAFVAAPWPPRDLDSDDDASTDVAERTNNTLLLRAESPYVPRALKFGGLGSVLATEDVDGIETMVYAASNWTVEAWVKPVAMPDDRVAVVRRATRDGDQSTFELGLTTNLAAYVGFNREDDGHSFFEVNTGAKTLPTNVWTHLAATYSVEDNRLILYVDGVEQIRGTDVSAQPVLARTGTLLLGSLGFEGELKEVRVWNHARSSEDVYANFGKTLLFSVALLENSFRSTGIEGNQSYLGRVTEPVEDGFTYDYTSIGAFGDEFRIINYTMGHLTHAFTLETWIRMQPGAAGGRAVSRQIDLMLVDQGSDWRITEALVIEPNGAPAVEWNGQVDIATPIYEEEEIPNPDPNKTNTIKRKVLNRLEMSTVVVPRKLISEVDIRDGQWHHLAAVGDSQQIRLYVDGQLETETSTYYVFKARPKPDFETLYWQYANGGSALRIGDSNLVADLDEVMFWNQDRTPSEIRNHMQYGLTAEEIKRWRRPIDPIPENAIDDSLARLERFGQAYPRVDLVSYMFFDGTPPLPFVVDAANEPLRYRILPDQNGDEILRNSRPPIFVDRLRALKDDLVGYFPADDGGETAENFMKRNDLGYSGLLQGDATFVAAPVTIDDTDGDGLPDWWEEANDLDAGDPNGANGAYGDADGDGLSNVAEYLAGTDPNNWDTDGDGDSDYNATSGGLTYGELYMDGDQIPDAWESLYGDVLSPLANDADVDPDGDGWKNLAEYLGAGYDVATTSVTNTTGEGTNTTIVVNTTEAVTRVAPTRPNDALSYPVPALTFVFTGEALATLGDSTPLRVWAYSDPLMRKPDALTAIPVAGLFANGMAATVTRWDSGHVRQGGNVFMAFIDANNDGKWNAGEWLGYSENGAENVQWGSSTIRIALTDKPAGYIRFSWEPQLDLIAAGLAQVNATTYKVVVNSVGENRNVYSVVRDLEAMERPYITEMDFKVAGVAPMWGSYNWYVATADGAVITAGTNFIAYGSSLAAPTVLSPSEETLDHAANRLRLRVSADAVKATIVVTRTNGATVLSTNVFLPAPNGDGTTEMDLPWLAGWGAFTNGDYVLRVSAINPVFPAGVQSAANAFSVDIQESPIGAGTIKGSLRYFGAHTAAVRVVEAFAGAGFDQKPAARARVAADGSYVLKGLRAGAYHVRGFVDANGNAALDVGEAWGFVKGTVSSVNLLAKKAQDAKASSDAQSPYAVEYSVKSVDLDAQGASEGQDLIAYDALAYRKVSLDVDRDGLPDDVEDALGTSSYRWDTDFDGLSDFEEVSVRGTSPVLADTDGDGLPDGWEVRYGLGALSTVGTNGAAGDPDLDALDNLGELAAGTSPILADTDSDGMEDGFEVAHGLDPLSAADAAGDWDGDGLTNLEESQGGTDPNLSDSDGDGLSDGDEIHVFGSNPLAADTDGDGFGDGEEAAAGTYPADPNDYPTGKTATTQFLRIGAAHGTATVVYAVSDLTGAPVDLLIQQNDVLPTQSDWTTTVTRTISAPGVYTNQVPDPDMDGRLNLRIRTR